MFATVVQGRVAVNDLRTHCQLLRRRAVDLPAPHAHSSRGPWPPIQFLDSGGVPPSALPNADPGRRSDPSNREEVCAR